MTMKRMLSLRDQKLKEKDRLKPKKKEKIAVHSRKEKSPKTFPSYSLDVTHDWAQRTTSWWIPTLSIFPLRLNWT